MASILILKKLEEEAPPFIVDYPLLKFPATKGFLDFDLICRLNY
jgi:hypothetical protein